jgi:hypothetical protein
MESREFKINIDNYLDNHLTIDRIKFQKMILLYNALEDGWALKKRKDAYVFTKNHEGKKEILHDDYLLKFMKNNIDFESTFESTFEKG